VKKPMAFASVVVGALAVAGLESLYRKRGPLRRRLTLPTAPPPARAALLPLPIYSRLFRSASQNRTLRGAMAAGLVASLAVHALVLGWWQLHSSTVTNATSGETITVSSVFLDISSRHTAPTPHAKAHRRVPRPASPKLAVATPATETELPLRPASSVPESRSTRALTARTALEIGGTPPESPEPRLRGYSTLLPPRALTLRPASRRAVALVSATDNVLDQGDTPRTSTVIEPAVAALAGAACSQPDVEARMLDKVVPPRPPLADIEQAYGVAQVEVDLSETGRVTGLSMYASSGSPTLDAAAKAAAARSSYAPRLAACRAAPGRYVYVVDFPAPR
jgi:TonB family protein